MNLNREPPRTDGLLDDGEYDPRFFWDLAAETFCRDEERQRLYLEHEILKGWVEKEHPTSLLQVGIGFGRELKMLAPLVPKLVGVDISDQMILNAKRYLGPENAGIELVQGDVTSLPFPNRSFDMVLTLGLLSHVPPNRIDRALLELQGVCRKRLILFELSPQLDGSRGQGRWAMGGGYPLTLSNCWGHNLVVWLLMRGATIHFAQVILEREGAGSDYTSILAEPLSDERRRALTGG